MLKVEKPLFIYKAVNNVNEYSVCPGYNLVLTMCLAKTDIDENLYSFSILLYANENKIA